LVGPSSEVFELSHNGGQCKEIIGGVQFMAWRLLSIFIAAEDAITQYATMVVVNVSWDTLTSNTDKVLSWIAIILSIIGLLYAKKSLRAPSVLAARKEHTEQMREFLKECVRKSL
jgi:hypothetical protein